jgi:hypothetical protein
MVLDSIPLFRLYFPPPPLIEFQVDKTYIQIGAAATLSWFDHEASYVWFGRRLTGINLQTGIETLNIDPGLDSQLVVKPAANTRYTFTVSQCRGQFSKSLEVDVYTPQPLPQIPEASWIYATNCAADYNTVRIWLFDKTPGVGQWTEAGQIPSQYPGLGNPCPDPNNAPFQIQLQDGHVYEIKAVWEKAGCTGNFDDTSDCIPAWIPVIKGKAGGPVWPWNI